MGRDLGRRRSASCRNVTPRPDSAEARDALTCSGPVSWIPQTPITKMVRSGAVFDVIGAVLIVTGVTIMAQVTGIA